MPNFVRIGVPLVRGLCVKTHPGILQINYPRLIMNYFRRWPNPVQSEILDAEVQGISSSERRWTGVRKGIPSCGACSHSACAGR